MIILRSHLLQRLTAINSSLLKIPNNSIYIHLKDHNKKINPQDTKLNLSYMSPKTQTDITPEQAEFRSKLNRKIQKDLDKKVFEDYKLKLLEGQIDTQEIIEPDPLWGEGDKPIHYYKNLSKNQASWLSYSQFMDLQEMRGQLIKKYFSNIKNIDSIDQCESLNDLGDLAVGYRLRGQLERQKFFEIEKKIGNLFHKISNRTLILLKFAFNQSPKLGTPTFNTILNDLLIESLPQLTKQDLIALFYANRHDGYKIYKQNLQKKILNQLNHFYEGMSMEEKIDWAFLYIDSRSPLIPRQAHNRHWNQIRQMAHAMLFKLDLPEDLSTLSEEQALKLTYVLYRGKTNMAEHIVESLANYVDSSLENNELSVRAGALFFIYFSEINGRKSIENQQLMARLKDFIIGNWQNYSKIDQIRTLYGMLVLNLYDEATHQLYTNIEMEADNTLLAYFCKIQLMSSSGREWQVMHLTAELQEIPIRYFQDYKRFYNYVRVTAPDWDLKPIEDKLVNTQIFYSSERLQSLSMDKPSYNKWKKLANFTQQGILPYSMFKLGMPIKNIEFADFMVWDYQISIDIVTDAQRIPGTRDLKGSFMAKIKSLENIGWRHLYIFQEDIALLESDSLFSYLHSICQPYFEEQTQVIGQNNSYKSDQIQYITNERYWKIMKGPEKEDWINDPQGKAKKDTENEEDLMFTRQMKEDNEGFSMDSQGENIMLTEYKRYMKAISGKK